MSRITKSFCKFTQKELILFRVSLLLGLFLCFQTVAEGNDFTKVKMTLVLKNTPIEQVLQTIETKTEFKFIYSSNQIDKNRYVNVKAYEKSIADILKEMFNGQNMIFHQKGYNIIIKPHNDPAYLKNVVPDPPKETQKAANGTIKGKVTDAQNGEPLPGASVVLKGTLKGGATDFTGEYQINLVPEGQQTLVVNYIGYVSQEVTVNVIPNNVNVVNITMKTSAQELGEIVIKGSLEGQEKALNQQKNADNIKNIVSADLIGRFPDLNVAEALQRIPGVNIERDRGEGGEVQMRGAPPAFTTINVNGEQIPGSQGQGQRNQELSTIPVDQLSSIEVTKAITPDQDGDNIGGTVDLKTPAAKSLKYKGKLELGGGYNNLVENLNFIGRGSINKRFFPNSKVDDGILGINLGGSYFSSNQGRDRTSYNYTATTSPATDGNEYILPTFYRFRDLENLRTRTGLAATIDLKLNPKNEILFNFMYSQRYDRDNERRVQFDFNRGTLANPQWEIANGEELPTSNRTTALRRFDNPRTFNVNTYSYSLIGNHILGKITMDYTLFLSLATNSDAKGRAYDFRSANFHADITDFGTDFANVAARNPDIDVHNPFFITRFLDWDNRETWVTTQNTSAKLNFTLPFDWNGRTGLIKFGGKYRTIDNNRNFFFQEFDYVGPGGAFMANIFPSYVLNEEDQQFMRNRIRFGPTMNAAALDAFISANPSFFNFDLANTLNETVPIFYNATEEVYAAYVMGKIQIKKLMLLGGFRYERTNVDYIANVYNIDGGDNIIENSIQRQSGGTNFDFLLPNIHARYSIDDLTNIRAAITSSFARSNFGQLVPSERISEVNQEIERGNPNLLPARSLNFDLLFERYFKNVGIISGGVFYKRIRDFNFTRFTTEQLTRSITNPVTMQSETQIIDFAVEQPANGDVANLLGAEINVQANLDFLPGILKGIGVYGNYTYTHSNANTFDRQDVRLQGQAQHTGNVAISFDYKGFTARAMFNFNGGVIRSYGPSADFDTWRNDRYQLDLSASYAFKKGFRIYAEFINLTNRPELEYFGKRSRPSNIEYYDWWSRFGVAYSF